MKKEGSGRMVGYSELEACSQAIILITLLDLSGECRFHLMMPSSLDSSLVLSREGKRSWSERRQDRVCSCRLRASASVAIPLNIKDVNLSTS